MPTISFDGRSFIIDGRRIWLVSGSIDYARVPAGLWARRITAAKTAGLNCISTHVFWNVHEPQAGRFSFDGQADLRRFIELIRDAGMYCILRPGPYVGGGWDFGGLPAWLTTLPQVRLRQAVPSLFLQACGRYLGAVMEQVRDLQVTAAPGPDQVGDLPGGGPIVLVQAEHEWCCYHPGQGQAYLQEIVRYLRENGCEIPITVANNFWQPVEGAIDTWNANEHLATDLRQMLLVQPDAPRLVSEFWVGQSDHWHQRHRPESASTCVYRLAQILSAGAQYNIHMFHGGTNFGFYGGRRTGQPAAFVTTSHDCGAPVTESGDLGPQYPAVKRISMFASQFGHVMAHLQPGPFHTSVAPNASRHPPSVIHLSGSQGHVVFVFKSEADRSRQIDLMLPDGLTLPVPMGQDRVAWLLLKANLGGMAELTYTNLRPWAFLHTGMLVLFGPPGADGMVAVNDAPLHLKVPVGRVPLVDRHEDLTIVVLNNEQVDATCLTPCGLVVGAASMEQNGPVHLSGWGQVTQVNLAGQVHRKRAKSPKPPTVAHEGPWQQAVQDELIDGTSGRFRPIDGPASLEQLGCQFGYGWYRITLPTRRKGLVMAPKSGDVLHLFLKGRRRLSWGRTDWTQRDPVRLEPASDLVVLADNLGRFDDGWHLGRPTGLWGHWYQVAPVKTGSPARELTEAPDPFELGGYFRGLRHGDRQPATALWWSVKSVGKQPLIVDLDNLPVAAMLVVNDQAVGLYDPHQSASFARFCVPFDPYLRRRGNEVRLALFERVDKVAPIVRAVHIYQATANLTARAKWAFAPWSVPEAAAFGPVSAGGAPVPCWYRCRFVVSSTTKALWLDPAGMSKGQIFLNGNNVGRYVVGPGSSRHAAAQKRYYLPEPWLDVKKPNVLTLFDEQGRHPGRCRFVYDTTGPF